MASKIPMARPTMDEEMIKAAADALRNERLVMGESVFKFEEEFARYIGTEYAISVASGTAALQLSLIAAGVRGKDVFTTPLSFVATANAVVEAGGTPKFADVRRDDRNLDPGSLAKALGKNSRAAMPVHLYGHPADLDPMIEECKRRRMVLIEDAAQAHGSVYKGKKIGSIGHIGCFSFYPTKNMTVGGDGGMVTTNDDKLAKDIAKLRDCGRISRYVHDVIGYTSRLNSCNAAIGRIQLRHLDEWNERRRAVASVYDRELHDVTQIAIPPSGSKDVTPVYHLYAVLAQKRDDLAAHLAQNGIECGVHYPVPIHLQPIYKEMYHYAEGSYPVTEELCGRLLSLPMFPGLSEAEIKTVCSAIRSFFKEG